MKRILVWTMLFVLGVFLSACGPKETWNYLVMGGATQEYATNFPKDYSAFIEKDQRVVVR